jgi:hypothetical protein
MRYIDMNFKVKAEMQSISELWESVEKLAKGRVQDNGKCDSYPIDIREKQLVSLRNLIENIESTHGAMQASNGAI